MPNRCNTHLSSRGWEFPSFSSRRLLFGAVLKVCPGGHTAHDKAALSPLSSCSKSGLVARHAERSHCHVPDGTSMVAQSISPSTCRMALKHLLASLELRIQICKLLGI